jgi:predicted nucleic acid-binding protein
MKYLLDTCVISELVKKEPHPAVIRWMDAGDESRLYLSVLTLGEIIKGITRLPDGEKREKLQSWVSNDLVMRFGQRLVAAGRGGEARRETARDRQPDRRHCQCPRSCRRHTQCAGHGALSGKSL